MIYKTYTGIWKPVLQLCVMQSLQWNTEWDWNGAWFVLEERQQLSEREPSYRVTNLVSCSTPSLFLVVSCSCPQQEHGRGAGFPPGILKFSAQSKWVKQHQDLGALSCHSAVRSVRQTLNLFLSHIPRTR